MRPVRTLCLWTCHECNRRWWTDADEPYEDHECPRHEHPMIERLDVDITETDVETARQ